jgi:diadenosine tetraphosphate (Ap4A) HIT family hydrolase
MKKKQKPFTPPKETPATRKRRLQQRLQELSDRSEQELAALMKSVEKVKSAFRSGNKS